MSTSKKVRTIFISNAKRCGVPGKTDEAIPTMCPFVPFSAATNVKCVRTNNSPMTGGSCHHIIVPEPGNFIQLWDILFQTSSSRLLTQQVPRL